MATATCGSMAPTPNPLTAGASQKPLAYNARYNLIVFVSRCVMICWENPRNLRYGTHQLTRTLPEWKTGVTTTIVRYIRACHTAWASPRPLLIGKVSGSIKPITLWSFLIWAATPTARKPPSPRASGEIANCLFWMHVNTQLNCGVMVENFDLPMSEFYKINPSVGADCSNLSLGSHYCIRTPDIPAIDGDISITPSPTSTTPPIASGTPSPIQVWNRALRGLCL